MRAISAFGPHVCLYKCDTSASSPEINPPAIKKGDITEAPRDLWSHNVLEDSGQKFILGLAKDVKQECEAEAQSREAES